MTCINLGYEKLLVEIQEKLDTKQPFLALRYGDGEAILLDNKNEGLIYHIFTRQLGFLLKSDDVLSIRNNLISAINDTDVLGIATQYHLGLEYYWSKSLEILSEFCNVKTDKFGSIDFHFEFLRNWENKESCFDKLLKDRDEIYTITCRDLQFGFKTRFNIKNVFNIWVPPEIMFENTLYRGQPHYPYRFNEVKNEILSLGNLKGKLLLYGAGFTGKIYGLFWKQQGGVAVDIGSVFDMFAGKNTRGPGHSCNSEILTHKL